MAIERTLDYGRKKTPQKIIEEMVSWRRDLHRFPELGFDEYRTSDLVAQRLTSFGLDVISSVGGTGVVGVLKKGDSARSLGLRADMDALPIQEKNQFEHRSRNCGVFHGCGHDGHTAMLLGAAKFLASHGVFDGTVHFIFQPAEEHGRGALAMIDDGLFDQCPMDAVYGLHNWPSLPLGKFALRSGAMMAAEDVFSITFKGAGGHASLPHLGADPLVAGAQAVSALQAIVSRAVAPMEIAVVSATEFETDGARNIIPSTVTIRGDARSFSEEVQAKIEAEMRRIADGVAAAAGMKAEIQYTNEFAILVNDPEATDCAVRAAASVAGAKNVDASCPFITVSEDFAWMLREKPGAYILMGTGGDAGLHNPRYDFRDEALSIGADYWTALVESLLAVDEGNEHDER